MSAQDKDGGPAFPHVNPNYDGNWDKEPQRAGMSIRDWFAGQAIAPYMAWSLGEPANDEVNDAESAAKKYASVAYMIADAMLKEREK